MQYTGAYDAKIRAAKKTTVINGSYNRKHGEAKLYPSPLLPLMAKSTYDICELGAYLGKVGRFNEGRIDILHMLVGGMVNLS